MCAKRGQPQLQNIPTSLHRTRNGIVDGVEIQRLYGCRFRCDRSCRCTVEHDGGERTRQTNREAVGIRYWSPFYRQLLNVHRAVEPDRVGEHRCSLVQRGTATALRRFMSAP